MSEYHAIDLKFKDEKVLLQTIKELGYQPEIHKKAVNLYGYQGDKREQKAHIVIPRKQVGSASNDVGFERVKKGFVLHASQYDKPWRTGEKRKQLNKNYAENKLKKQVNNMSNCSIRNRKINKKGQIEINLRILN